MSRLFDLFCRRRPSDPWFDQDRSMLPQGTCSATTRTYRQFLSNSGVCVSVDEKASYLPQSASKQARVFWDAEDSLLHVNSGVQSMYSWAAVVSHPATTSTPNSSMITLTRTSPGFDPQLMVASPPSFTTSSFGLR